RDFHVTGVQTCALPIWPQPAAIAPTFTQVDFAVVEDSGTVCRACAALTKAATFQEVVRARGMDVKLWTQAGWHCYSHLFVYPDRSEERRVGDECRSW